MKTFKLLAFLFCCFVSGNLLAQTPETITNDLYQSFKKIHYWKLYGREHSDSIVMARDSLDKADDLFGHKLKRYTGIYSFTLSMPFGKFEDMPLGIHTAEDGLFRIYSWDNEGGGTMRYFENVLQYKAGGKVYSILQKDTSENGGGYIYEYDSVHILKTSGKTYYLATFSGRFSTKDIIYGIQVFSIEDSKLNDDVKLIKTDSGLRSKLAYRFNIFSVTHEIQDKDIHFDKKSKTITLPVVLAHGRITNGRIIYKFTGRYFERVKN